MLLLHQCNRRGPSTGYETLAPLLAGSGFHVLTIDSRGFGRSRDERYRDYHEQMELIDRFVAGDVESAYRFLAARPGVDASRIGIVGASCGAWQAIPLAAAHEEIRTLVFLSGSYLDLETVSRAYEDVTDRPVLAVYAEDDRFRTPESMRDAFARSRHPGSRLLVYKGDLHGTPLFDLDEGLEGEIAAWLRQRLVAR